MKNTIKQISKLIFGLFFATSGVINGIGLADALTTENIELKDIIHNKPFVAYNGFRFKNSIVIKHKEENRMIAASVAEFWQYMLFEFDASSPA
ncbi:MAG: hypothetical protein WC707_06555 [Candidatus Babeliaceae bacterium]|jgi:hypothetical protein